TLADYTLSDNLENLIGAVATGQSLTGNAANNTIIGEAGDDVLTGLGGVDTLKGGAGADRLIGGDGNDILTGGTGADVFVASLAGGADGVVDFVVGTDRIDVTAFGAYQSIVQSGADTIVTLATGVTFKLVGVTASSLTDASFIGLAAPAPALLADPDKTEVHKAPPDAVPVGASDPGWFI
ncbi:MAG: M10 family metallopeptidase C-terminal domain-containing protein, partial [Caulobacter sp.]|nr:M10 family metallopeptidase C-terminal domain-containing protein [Caulobacter sp.]